MEPQPSAVKDYNGHTPEADPPAGAAPGPGYDRPTDEQGRILVDHMANRELFEEAVTTLRQFADGLAQFNEHAHSNPMMKNLLGL